MTVDEALAFVAKMKEYGVDRFKFQNLEVCFAGEWEAAAPSQPVYTPPVINDDELEAMTEEQLVSIRQQLLKRRERDNYRSA